MLKLQSLKKKNLSIFNALLIVVFLTIASNSLAQEPYLRVARVIDPHDVGMIRFSGLSYVPANGMFLVLSSINESKSTIKLLNEAGKVAGQINIQSVLQTPSSMSFDPKGNRLLFFDQPGDKLIYFKTSRNGLPISENFLSTNMPSDNSLGIDIRGMTVNPVNGNLYLLDSQAASLLCIFPVGHEDTSTLNTGEIEKTAVIDLKMLQEKDLCGLAVHPQTEHFFLTCTSEKKLYEINSLGEIITIRDLSVLNLKEPQCMIFAPSGDQTDDPSQLSLYMLDAGLNQHLGGIVELVIDKPEQLDLSAITVKVTSFRVRRLDDKRRLSKVSVGAPAVPSILDNPINVILTSGWTPPSPDPSGIAYIPSSGTLLICDGEVEEIGSGHPGAYDGANVWESNYSGAVLDYWNTLDFSDEPTGVAYNPVNHHLYFSDDTGDRYVWELNPGSDMLPGTGDDIITFFVTDDYSSHDPEGITYNTVNGHLHIADGENSEVYEVDPGNNGMFDGIAPGGDDLVSHFDTQTLGLTDPEGVEFNTFTGHLYILSSNNDIIVETTTDGSAVRVFDISDFGADAPAGLAHAPGSINPGEWSIYITDRAQDNNSHPDENDGKIYEFSDMDISLPVELVNFSADVSKNKITLEWATESEVDNLGFDLMRAEEENGAYRVISSYKENTDLQGQVNSAERHTYSYVDQTISPGKIYWYRLADWDISGRRILHQPISVTVDETSFYPKDLKLYSNYPNPFNPSTLIKFEIPLLRDGNAQTTLLIYNSLGQIIKTLVHKNLAAGNYEILWDGTADNQNTAPAGVYFARLNTGPYSDAIKMVLLR